jgi:hypothetical protein
MFISKKLKITLLFGVLLVVGILRLGPHYDERGRFPEQSSQSPLSEYGCF